MTYFTYCAPTCQAAPLHLADTAAPACIDHALLRQLEDDQNLAHAMCNPSPNTVTEDDLITILAIHADASTPPLPARAGKGQTSIITTKMRDNISRRRAAHALVRVLPLYSHARVLGRSVDRMLTATYEEGDEYVIRLLERLVEYYIRWGVSSVRGAASALDRLRVFAVANDDHEAAEACSFSPEISDQWLIYVRTSATTTATARIAAAAAAGRELTNAQARRDGSGAEETAFRALRWLLDNARVNTSARDPLVAKRNLDRQPPMPTRSLEPPHYYQLCWHAANNPLRVVRGTSAGLAFTASQVYRLQQSQTSCVIAETENVVWSATQLDKSNQPHKRRPRPAFGPLYDACGGRGVIDALYDSLSGVEEGCFTIRDNDSREGAPNESTEFIDGPMTAPRVDAALQHILQLPPLSMPEREAREFTNRSLKPFMLKHAARMGCDPVRRHGMGRFSGSAAQDPAMIPEAALLARHRVKCSQLPNRYAQSTSLGADVSESLRVMADIRRLCAAHSIQQLSEMDWSDIPDGDTLLATRGEQ